MPKDKEGSAVATLLNEINRLRERVDILESWLGVGRPRTSDVIGYRGVYEDMGPRPSLDRTNEVITINTPLNGVNVRDGNDTIPLADVRITDDGYTRTATYCTRTHS